MRDRGNVAMSRSQVTTYDLLRQTRHYREVRGRHRLHALELGYNVSCRIGIQMNCHIGRQYRDR